VDILTDKNFVHPADALALALDRATGLLAILGDFYNPANESFASGNSFVSHALTAASGLLMDARSSLMDLHDGCDLVMRDSAADGEAGVEEPVVAFTRSSSVKVQSPPPTQTWPEPDVVYQSPAPAQEQFQPAPARVMSEQEHFAKSYLELLKKLTAAEVFASEQQALSVPGTATDLLPLLRGLREDFQKMHNVG
jgi:hypothetical protein